MIEKIKTKDLTNKQIETKKERKRKPCSEKGESTPERIHVGFLGKSPI